MDGMGWDIKQHVCLVNTVQQRIEILTDLVKETLDLIHESRRKDKKESSEATEKSQDDRNTT